jgi:sortase (surface protein transpeptidase)
MTSAVLGINRRATGWAACAAGLGALAAAVVLGIQSARPPAPVGALPAATPQHPAARPSTGANSAAPAAPTTMRGVPTRLSIEELHVDAPVEAVGVAPDRALDIPAHPAKVGWWIGSAMPGSSHGTVLIAGHVDTARDGPGALFTLETLRMGAHIQIEAANQTITYRAVARRSYPKQRLPKQLFSPNTPAELALVTCGGTYRHGTYSHNVVVYAQPVPRRYGPV